MWPGTCYVIGIRISHTLLRTLITQFQSNFNAFKTLDLSIPLHEVLLSQIPIEHMAEVTRKQWEVKSVTQWFTELKELIKFLKDKCQALKLIHESHQPQNCNSEISSSKPSTHM